MLRGWLLCDGIGRTDLIQPGQQNDLEVLESEEVGMIERHA